MSDKPEISVQQPIDLTDFQNAISRRLVPTGAPGEVLDEDTGLTHAPGLVKGARPRLRAIIQEGVEREAKGRSWPSRAARREWVRTETRRRYHALTTPSSLG